MHAYRLQLLGRKNIYKNSILLYGYSYLIISLFFNTYFNQLWSQLSLICRNCTSLNDDFTLVGCKLFFYFNIKIDDGWTSVNKHISWAKKSFLNVFLKRRPPPKHTKQVWKSTNSKFHALLIWKQFVHAWCCFWI